MEFLFIVAFVVIVTRKYKAEKGVKPVMLNPGHYHDKNAFMVMYHLVMKEGRIKE